MPADSFGSLATRLLCCALLLAGRLTAQASKSTPTTADTPVIERVSLSSVNAQSSALSADALISSDGRYIAFSSDASNLVAGDTNAVRDAFVRDRLTNTTTRVSVSSAGVQGNALSSVSDPSPMSADGRFVVFYSSASNLVAGDTNL